MDTNASFGGEKCLCIQLSAFSLSNRGCLKSFMQALCGTFEVKIPVFLFHQIYCGFFFFFRSQRNHPLSWAVTYQPMTSTLLQALETRRPRCMKWSTRLRGNRLEHSGLWRRKRGHTASHSSDSPSQTDRNSPCLSVWLSVSHSLTFYWLTAEVDEWILGWPWTELPGLRHECAALQTPNTRPSSYGTREHSMFPFSLFFLFCFCFLLQIFLFSYVFFSSLCSENVP